MQDEVKIGDTKLGSHYMICTLTAAGQAEVGLPLTVTALRRCLIFSMYLGEVNIRRTLHSGYLTGFAMECLRWATKCGFCAWRGYDNIKEGSQLCIGCGWQRYLGYRDSRDVVLKTS